MILNQYEFERYIRSSAARGGLTVRWKEDACPATDGRQIFLPTLNRNATETEYRKLLQHVNHEVSHINYTDTERGEERNVHIGNSFLGAIHNAVEDHRIEWLNGREYPGDRQNADFVYTVLYQEAVARTDKSAKTLGPDEKEFLSRVQSLLWFLLEANNDMYSNCVLLQKDLVEKMEAGGLTYIGKMKAGDYIDVLRNIRNIEEKVEGTEATYQLARRIYEEVYGLDAKAEEERCKKQKEDAGKGKGKPQPAASGEGEGEKGKGEKGKGEGKKGEEEGEGEGKEEGKGKGKRDDQTDLGEVHVSESGGIADESEKGAAKHGTLVRDKLITSKYKDIETVPHDLDPTARAHNIEGKGMHLDYTDLDRGANYAPAKQEDVMVQDFPNKEFSSSEFAGDGGYHTSARVIQDYRTITGGSNVASFTNQVRMRLQIRTRARHEYGVKRGKLQQSLLHRVTRNDDPEMQQRVFKRKIVSDTLDTAVCWLGDASGSMGGDKYAHLMGASVQINEAIGNVIRVPLEILTFSDAVSPKTRTYEPLMYVIRQYSDKRLGTDELLRRMAIAGTHMSSNPDGDAIIFAYDRLLRQKAKRKVLIVASDGSPATSRGHGIVPYTQDVVKAIEKDPRVEIVGIGICDDNVRDIYKEHYIIHDSAELEKALLALIDKKLV